jgi:hypothetical protein
MFSSAQKKHLKIFSQSTHYVRNSPKMDSWMRQNFAKSSQVENACQNLSGNSEKEDNF